MKSAGGRRIAGDQLVDDLAVLVDRPIRGHLLPRNHHRRLGYQPAISRDVLAGMDAVKCCNRDCCGSEGQDQAGSVDASALSSSVSIEVGLLWVSLPSECLRYGLSYRDVEKPLTERGITVDHVSVYRWVQRFTPLLIDAARPYRHAVGDRWFIDETM
jgi:hypothetical protein